MNLERYLFRDTIKLTISIDEMILNRISHSFLYYYTFNIFLERVVTLLRNHKQYEKESFRFNNELCESSRISTQEKLFDSTISKQRYTILITMRSRSPSFSVSVCPSIYLSLSVSLPPTCSRHHCRCTSTQPPYSTSHDPGNNPGRHDNSDPDRPCDQHDQHRDVDQFRANRHLHPG